MEVDPWFYEAGLWGLFLATMLSATVLPLASEVLLVFMLDKGFNVNTVLFIATLGNTLGGMITYFMGRILPLQQAVSRLDLSGRKVQSWTKRIKGNAPIWALFCWMPFIGDALALALGAVRSTLLPTCLFMCLGKALRFAVLIAVWHAFLG